MRTNDLKKGTRVQLRCGWYATIADNAKGAVRMCDVEGDVREIGGVYSHDIMRALVADGSVPHQWVEVEHTPAQLDLRTTMLSFGRTFD
jgi:hypothetical protein